MNFTFLIGNGFDLNLGLKTRYTDFLEYYKTINEDDSNGVRFLKEQICNEETGYLWSNAEEAFGQSTAQYVANNLNAIDFCESHENFCYKLSEYLINQQDKYNFSKLKTTIAKAFVAGLQSYIKGFKEVEATQIKNVIDSFQNGGFKYNFINFNYTNTLDLCISAVKANNGILGKRRLNNNVFDNSIGSVIHVHGTTKNSMVLGVNDKSQIADLRIFDGYGDEYIGSIIKQQTNELNRENTDKKAFDILKNSDLIYVYGMSIGITDKLWWERICQLMEMNKRLHLILHVFNAPKPQLFMREVIIFERNKRSEFMHYFKPKKISDESHITEIANRIHIDSSNIFCALEGLSTESQKNVSLVSL